MTIWDDLAAEFPRSAISWRAQSVTKNGDKAMALAYLDARDVRKRLNDVLGPANWQNEFRDCGGGKLACRLSVRVDGEWISKEDGAGETQVEAEKGAFSSALKRAAVAFGVGEYLYDLPTVWVPCETLDYNGKKQWKSWKDDPWNHVRSQSPAQRKPVAAESNNPAPEQPSLYKRLSVANSACADKAAFNALWGNPKTISAQSRLTDEESARLETEKANKFSELEEREPSDYVPPDFSAMSEGEQAARNLRAG